MFKIARKVLVGMALICLVGALYHFGTKYRRTIVQKATEWHERYREGERRPIWQGMGVVTNVIDGDLVMLHTEQHPMVVAQLAGIDAPEVVRQKGEPGQPLANESKEFLEKLLKDQAILVSIVGVDAYQRPVVLLHRGETLLNAEPVQAGLAELTEDVPSLPAKIRHALQNAEADAQAKSLGIWGLTNYQRPCEYRLRYPLVPKP